MSLLKCLIRTIKPSPYSNVSLDPPLITGWWISIMNVYKHNLVIIRKIIELEYIKWFKSLEIESGGCELFVSAFKDASTILENLNNLNELFWYDYK